MMSTCLLERLGRLVLYTFTRTRLARKKGRERKKGSYPEEGKGQKDGVELHSLPPCCGLGKRRKKKKGGGEQILLKEKHDRAGLCLGLPLSLLSRLTHQAARKKKGKKGRKKKKPRA